MERLYIDVNDDILNTMLMYGVVKYLGKENVAFIINDDYAYDVGVRGYDVKLNVSETLYNSKLVGKSELLNALNELSYTSLKKQLSGKCDRRYAMPFKIPLVNTNLCYPHVAAVATLGFVHGVAVLKTPEITTYALAIPRDREIAVEDVYAYQKFGEYYGELHKPVALDVVPLYVFAFSQADSKYLSSKNFDIVTWYVHGNHFEMFRARGTNVAKFLLHYGDFKLCINALLNKAPEELTELSNAVDLNDTTYVKHTKIKNVKECDYEKIASYFAR